MIIPLIVKRSLTIEAIKDKIHEMGGIPSDRQRLMYGVKELDNGCTLSNYEIEEESTIYNVPVESMYNATVKGGQIIRGAEFLVE